MLTVLHASRHVALPATDRASASTVANWLRFQLEAEGADARRLDPEAYRVSVPRLVSTSPAAAFLLPSVSNAVIDVTEDAAGVRIDVDVQLRLWAQVAVLGSLTGAFTGFFVREPLPAVGVLCLLGLFWLGAWLSLRQFLRKADLNVHARFVEGRSLPLL